MKKVLVFAVAIVLFSGLFCSAQAMDGNIEVISLAGDAKVISPGAAAGEACLPGMRLREGSQVVTGMESYVEIALDDSKMNLLKIKENSRVAIKLEGPDKIELVDGEIFTLLQNLEPGEVFRVRTPCATCGARGTGWRTKTDGKATEVSVFQDQVFVRGVKKDGSAMEKQYTVKAGYERKIKKFSKPEKMRKISSKRLARMKKEIKRSPQAPKKPQKVKKIKTPEKPAVKEKLTEKLDQKIKRHEMIEKQTGKAEGRMEQEQQSKIDRKDDLKLQSDERRRPPEPTVSDAIKK
ncbi:MAG: FecR family protein [Candidatus Omnitrophota bacterium]